MYTFATLGQFRRRLGLDEIDTSDDDYLIAMLETASTMMERMSHRRFQPHVAALPHTVPQQDRTRLTLRDDLLALTSLTNGDGSLIPAGDIRLLPDPGWEPISQIALLNGAAFVHEESALNALTVEGIWGWHNHWDAAWENSDDTVQDDPFAVSSTTLTVQDADASKDGEPRFQVGHLLRIGEEYLRVTAVDTDDNTLTVRRGANGTAAANHAAGSPITIYQPPLDVKMLCLRWAQWLYHERDTRSIADIPAVLLAGLAPLKRISVMS